MRRPLKSIHFETIGDKFLATAARFCRARLRLFLVDRIHRAQSGGHPSRIQGGQCSGADDLTPLTAAVPDLLRNTPGVAAVDLFHGMATHYRGERALLGGTHPPRRVGKRPRPSPARAPPSGAKSAPQKAARSAGRSSPRLRRRWRKFRDPSTFLAARRLSGIELPSRFPTLPDGGNSALRGRLHRHAFTATSGRSKATKTPCAASLRHRSTSTAPHPNAWDKCRASLAQLAKMK